MPKPTIGFKGPAPWSHRQKRRLLITTLITLYLMGAFAVFGYKYNYVMDQTCRRPEITCNDNMLEKAQQLAVIGGLSHGFLWPIIKPVYWIGSASIWLTR